MPLHANSVRLVQTPISMIFSTCFSLNVQQNAVSMPAWQQPPSLISPLRLELLVILKEILYDLVLKDWQKVLIELWDVGKSQHDRS